MYVLLFDIDGTLINSGGAGSAAMADAFVALFGVDSPHDVPVHGQTDRGIAGSLFKAHGIEDSQQHWDRLREAYVTKLAENLPRTSGFVLDGVITILGQLAERDDVAVGLLTGNVLAGARVKLEFFKLMHHFAFGGYGDHHHDRNDVARQALGEARRHLNGQVHPERTWVIGDTPNDVRCARAIGARVAAVSTGNYASNELAAAKPDVLLHSMADSRPILDLLD